MWNNRFTHINDIDLVGLFFILVFKYLAEKYLQKLKQQITEDPELMHSSSNKIGKYPKNFDPSMPGIFILHSLLCILIMSISWRSMIKKY